LLMNGRLSFTDRSRSCCCCRSTFILQASHCLGGLLVCMYLFTN
jgi:hypothetical protein